MLDLKGGRGFSGLSFIFIIFIISAGHPDTFESACWQPCFSNQLMGSGCPQREGGQEVIALRPGAELPNETALQQVSLLLQGESAAEVMACVCVWGSGTQ